MATGTAIVVVVIGIILATSPRGVTPPHVPDGSFTALVPPWPIFNVAVSINTFFVTLARLTTPPDVAAIELATSWWKSEVMYGLGYNGIFEVLGAAADGLTCQEVATQLHLQDFVVCQYLNAGVELHVLAKKKATAAASDETSSSSSSSSSSTTTAYSYSLTSVGEMYLQEKLYSFLMMINEEPQEAWRKVSTEVIQSGQMSGWQARFGTDVWTYYKAHPAKNAQFDRAMASLGPGPTGAMLLDWNPANFGHGEDATRNLTLCDIGGGFGHVLAHVLKHYPNMKGLILDQPETAERANVYLKEQGVDDRVKAIGGSFFQPFPAQFSECDIFHLRFIIHDWSDPENIAILKNIKLAATASNNTPHTQKSVMIVDHVIDTGASPAMEQSKRLMSINMVASNTYGSRERTVAEHGALFGAAGFQGANNIKVTPLRTIQTLLEAEI